MKKNLLVILAAFVGMTMVAQQDDQKKDSCQKKPAKVVKVKKEGYGKTAENDHQSCPNRMFQTRQYQGRNLFPNIFKRFNNMMFGTIKQEAERFSQKVTTGMGEVRLRERS